MSSSSPSHGIASSSRAVKRSNTSGVPIWATGLAVCSAKATRRAVSDSRRYSRKSSASPERGAEHRRDLGEHDAASTAHRAGPRRNGTDLQASLEAGRRRGIDSPAQVEIDGVVHHRSIQLEMVVGDDSGAAEPAPRGGVEARLLALVQRRKRVESRSNTDVKEVEVLIEQDAAWVWCSLVGKVEAQVFGTRAIDSRTRGHSYPSQQRRLIMSRTPN